MDTELPARSPHRSPSRSGRARLEPTDASAATPRRVAELETTLLSEGAIQFLTELSHRFEPTRNELLQARPLFHARITAGERPGFLPETRSIRHASWTAAPPAAGLVDRRVEITGPPERRMVIHALNSGASVYMADFEDAHAPTWRGTLEGQANLIDAVRETITTEGSGGQRLALTQPHATLMVRPRGWHLKERHCPVDGVPISASLFDFGLFFFHNAHELVRRGLGPYYYLPKIEHWREAALWSEVFDFCEDWAKLPRGTVRATALIETLPAIFEAEEVLYALRKHSAGLNCGRWDYIFSFIKQFRDDPTAVFPDRDALTMTSPFLDAYARRIIQVCHRRGAHAMGGMAAQIPIKHHPEANAEALAHVAADKEREVALGHDGTWVAHPGLVVLAKEIFDRGMPGPNQLDRPSDGREITPTELLAIPRGEITRAGVRRNVHVALRYLAAWLDGMGCVPIDHRMEDAATVEISRSQLWQWIRNRSALREGGVVTAELVWAEIRREAQHAAHAEGSGPPPRNLVRAGELLDELATSTTFTEFFTTRAYELLEPSEDLRP